MIATASVRQLLVVVPARDEEVLLGPCLDSLDVAVETVRASRPELAVRIVVVADRCVDRTADVARESGAHVVQIDEGSVGAARRAGVDAGIALLPPDTADLTWVASTDADTRVPPAWLEHQVGLASRGVRLMIGLAVPDQGDLDATTWMRWRRRHASTALGVHIYGANLGFRLNDYHAAGGWPRLREHEDQHLVDAFLAGGVRAAAGLDVITSGRLQGRVVSGFSSYLREIAGPDPIGLPDAG